MLIYFLTGFWGRVPENIHLNIFQMESGAETARPFSFGAYHIISVVLVFLYHYEINVSEG